CSAPARSRSAERVQTVLELSYVVAAVLFIIGLKMLGRAESARRGNLMSALAMFIAVVATLFQAGVHYGWIVTGIVIGGAIGAFIARRVQMTQMPEVVAL